MEIIRLPKSKVSHAMVQCCSSAGEGWGIWRTDRDKHPIAFPGTEPQEVSLQLFYSVNIYLRKNFLKTSFFPPRTPC
jgi:hypothetical protein